MVARKEGYQIIVVSSKFDFNNEDKYINRMLDMGVDGFIIQGYNNFILLTENPKISMPIWERKKAFIETLERLKVNYKVEIIDDEIKREDINKAIDRALKPGSKNLIFAVDWEILQKAYDYIIYKKLDIPNEVGILGFEDRRWTYYANPSVTTISQPIYE